MLSYIARATSDDGSPAAGDKAYDEASVSEQLRALHVTPHCAKHESAGRRSNPDCRTTRHARYEISLKKRKRIEHIFGCLKTAAALRRVRHRGRALVEWMCNLTLSGYDLLRMSWLKTA